MNDVIYLAWRYLAYHKLKTIVLTASMAAIVYIPLGLNILLNRTAIELRGRATTTPLLVGDKGSPTELVLRALYFESDTPKPVAYAQLERIETSRLAEAIPLHARFQTRYGPIVGTTLEYFRFRDLTIAQGRQLAMLGECVIGCEAARAGGLSPGDYVVSSTDNLFDIAGVYPLKMKVVGVLRPSDSPDDRAVFVDIKTAWVIEGLGHGHQDLSRPEAAERVLGKKGGAIVANDSVVKYNEITKENVSSFHFHGSQSEFPLTAIIAAPRNQKSSVVLQGRYLSDDEVVQIVRPISVIDDLLGTVFSVGRYASATVLLVALATLSTMALVFVLSLQLRRRELETMAKIGGAPRRIRSILGAEVMGVLGIGALLAGLLALVTSSFGAAAVRLLIQLS